MQYDTLEKAKGICPVGWHIPSKTEFDTLSKFVLGKGNSLKTINQGKENGIGTNTSGFSALLSGYRYINGVFYRYKKTACFWSSTKFSDTLVNNMNLNEKDNDASLDKFNLINAFSVRCILDF
jgi:uncharacterized protein (TIGR02145 family)